MESSSIEEKNQLKSGESNKPRTDESSGRKEPRKVSTQDKSELSTPTHNLPFLLPAIRARRILQGLDQNRHGLLREIARIPELIQVVGEFGGDLLEMEAFEVVGCFGLIIIIIGRIRLLRVVFV